MLIEIEFVNMRAEFPVPNAFLFSYILVLCYAVQTKHFIAWNRNPNIVVNLKKKRQIYFRVYFEINIACY